MELESLEDYETELHNLYLKSNTMRDHTAQCGGWGSKKETPEETKEE